ARTGTRWGRLQALKNHLIYAAVCALLALADRLPRGLLLRAGRALGRSAHALLGQSRQIARRNLATACPELNELQVNALTRRSFINAGENLTRTLLLRRASFRARDHVHVAEDALDALAAARAAGRGVVFVSAHLGPFEWLAAAIAEHGFRPVIVVRESYDRRLSRIVDQHRVARGIEVIHRGAPGADVAIVRALRSGRAVGFLPDLASRVRAVPTRWLGHLQPMPIGPSQLALRLNSALMIGTLQPNLAGNGFKLRLEPLVVDPSKDMTQSVANGLDRAIRGAAEHWLWMARPLGES
ncbi:MAG TPA: lysophospholipid acyltransferase family protein, partial [Polyangiaceae bacterium]|nr:lysophospholipid acyltransferase family protein [Polyangiaceae bacterium]